MEFLLFMQWKHVGEMGPKLHSFLPSTCDEVNNQLHELVALPHVKGWEGHRAGLEILKYRKNISRLSGIERRFFGCV